MNYKFNEDFIGELLFQHFKQKEPMKVMEKVILLLMCGLRRNQKDFLVEREIG